MIISSADPKQRTSTGPSTPCQARLLSIMQLTVTQSDSLVPAHLERLLLPCISDCTSHELAVMQTHLHRLRLTATSVMRDAQGGRLTELLAALVAEEDTPPQLHEPVPHTGTQRKHKHSSKAVLRASSSSSTSCELHLRDVLTMLASFSAAGGAPATLDHTALRDSLPQLLCQAHGKAVADLLREIAVLKIPLSRTQQVALGRAVNRHVKEMGAAAMSKVLSALSSCRCAVVLLSALYALLGCCCRRRRRCQSQRNLFPAVDSHPSSSTTAVV